MRELSITTEACDTGGCPVRVVRVSGYIDAHSFPRFEREILTLVNQGNNRLLLDLRNATYICSTALGLLMSVFRQVRHNAGDLVIAGMSEKIANIFNLLGISKLIQAFPDEEEALRCLAAAEAS
ncbi:MAG: STAS domain-containing protein [Armatimonadetes bacterium]|nr:STAS domain-containing protein [Armatimonadota bacterium]